MKRALLSSIAVLGGLALSACGTGSGSASPSASAPLKVAWVYVGSRSDAGWTKAHDDGRLMVEQHFGSRVQTTYKENVPEGPQAQQVVEQLVQDGNKLIFATSFGFQDAMDAEAKLHPDVYFEQATGFKMEKNLAEYFGAAEDADFLTGMALGAATKNGRIGFVAPFAIPEVIREINAVTLGARAMHPGATVQVVWTNTWFDPAKEKQAAQSLIQRGVDAIGQGQDSPATGDAAKAAGVKWTGYDSDQQAFAPDVWLTGTVYHWGPYYVSRVQKVLDGTWTSGSYYGTMKDDFVDIAPFGTSVPQSARDAINQKKAALKDGSFYEFTGPITDQSGAVHVPAGQKLTLNDILTMDWFVEGVIGNPKGS